MFEMVETHREDYTKTFMQSYPGQKAPGTIIFRDRARGITVTHHHTHLGGALYATGHVIVRNNRNGASHTYHTTTSPIDARAAAEMAWFKRDAIGYTEN
jgi:hypothetical protein